MSPTRSLVTQLRSMPVFRTLPRDQLKVIADTAELLKLNAGEVVYRQGDPASACFVLLRGSIRLTVTLSGRTTVADLAFADDLFGLESLRPRGKYTETATAVGPVELLEIGRVPMKQLLVDNSGWQLELLDYLVDKLNEKSAHAVRTGHYDAEQRIAAYLISQDAGGTSGKPRANKALSQADLASYLALTPETFCRKVSKFRRLGWISGSGNEYVVKKRDALQQLLKQ